MCSWVRSQDVVDGDPSCWELCIHLNDNVSGGGAGGGVWLEQSTDDNDCCVFTEFVGGGSTNFREVESCSCGGTTIATTQATITSGCKSSPLSAVLLSAKCCLTL